MTNATPHRLGLTVSAAARHLGVSISTVRRWSDLGYLRGYRTPGGQRRFSVVQLDDFMDSLQSGGPVRHVSETAPFAEGPRFTLDGLFAD